MKIRFKNIQSNSRTFEGTRMKKSNSRTFETFGALCEPCFQHWHDNHEHISCQSPRETYNWLPLLCCRWAFSADLRPAFTLGTMRSSASNTSSVLSGMLGLAVAMSATWGRWVQGVDVMKDAVPPRHPFPGFFRGVMVSVTCHQKGKGKFYRVQQLHDDIHHCL